MKVLLVGNGCSAAEHKLGKFIDSEFDLVLRMNRFKTIVFEEYVGSKTDLWVDTDNTIKWVYEKTDGIEGSHNWKNYRGIYMGIPSFKINYLTGGTGNIDAMAKEASKDLNIPVYIFPPQIADMITSKLKLPSDQWPTLGIQCLYTLLLDTNINDIFIYGFDGKDKKYEYFHYYDIGKPEWRTDTYYNKKLNHADKKEFENIQELIKYKKIKKLQDYYESEE